MAARALPAELGSPPFERIKTFLAEKERLLLSTLDPELLLPNSYFELWGPNQQSKKATELIAAFGQFPRLPRLLRPRALFDSIVRGVREGKLVLRLARDDNSIRTFWINPPDDDTLLRPQIEIVPAEYATLYSLDPELLIPDKMPGLWPPTNDPVRLENLRSFFDGKRAPRLASADILDSAVRTAVTMRGSLMARLETKTFLREMLPPGELSADLVLLLPPPPVRGTDLSPKALPEAWRENFASLSDLAEALATRRGYHVPWILLREGVSEALAAHLFELTADSASWPISSDALHQVRFQIVKVVELDPTEWVDYPDLWENGTATLKKVKETLELRYGQTISLDLLRRTVESAINKGLISSESGKTLPLTDALLKTRVRLPKATLVTEAILTPKQIQDLAPVIAKLKQIAPDLDFSFRLVITVEGEKPSQDVVEHLNGLLGDIKQGWKLEG